MARERKAARAWKYGDQIDTDVIIPARYLTTSDESELGKHALEDLDPSFVAKVHPGDVLVAGANFGCGSSREHATLALKGAGISAVIAHSFARIFFRNAINKGLPILVCLDAAASIESGDEVEVDLATGTIRNLTRSAEFHAEPLPEFVQQIAAAGGLVTYVKDRLEAGAG